MYRNAHAIAPKLINMTQPTNDSTALITINRSGAIDSCQILTSCGINKLDEHHIKLIESIGTFPPIPKYIEAPLQIPATLHFGHNQSFTGSFSLPVKRR